VIYDCVEQAYTVLAANFATDYAALLSAKSVTSPGTVKLVKRQKVETALRYGAQPPLLGIVSLAARTQAKDQGKRDTQALVGYDFYVSGSDPALVAKQVELGAEACMRSVDRLAASGLGVFGAGETPLSVTITLSDDEEEEVQEGKYGRRATVSFPMWDRDEGV
jgi:hypothetical protein